MNLADAPFDREDPTLHPVAGACTDCPRRSGYNTALFSDVLSDKCLDGKCFQTKVANHIDREIAATPGLIQVENGWRSPKEKRPGSVQSGHYREIEAVIANPDAEPAPPCAAAKAAIVVYGKRIGTKLTVCTDKHCPVHDPTPATEAAVRTVPPIAPAPDAGAGERERYPEEKEEFDAEQETLAAERKLQREREFQRQQKEHEAEQAQRNEVLKTRSATFERILGNAPATLSAAQLRILLRALVTLAPYTFAEDLAGEIAGDDENEQRTAEEVLLSAIDRTADPQLTRFALRLALTGHTAIPREGETDFLAEADAAFAPHNRRRPAHGRRGNQPRSRPPPEPRPIRKHPGRKPPPKPQAGARPPAPAPFPKALNI